MRHYIYARLDPQHSIELLGGRWCVGGGVDTTQLFTEAACRESEEEAHCEILLTGLLQLEV